jgi:hypothetical protein
VHGKPSLLFGTVSTRHLNGRLSTVLKYCLPPLFFQLKSRSLLGLSANCALFTRTMAFAIGRSQTDGLRCVDNIITFQAVEEMYHRRLDAEITFAIALGVAEGAAARAWRRIQYFSTVFVRCRMCAGNALPTAAPRLVG